MKQRSSATYNQDSGGARRVVCKGCGGAAICEHGSAPAGWFNLTVAVPPWMAERGYLWVGQYCSVACLASSVPELARQERMAHQVYQPIRPEAGAQ